MINNLTKILSRSGLNIGLTGNIASGKSYIGNILTRYGFQVYSLDTFAQHLINNNRKVQIVLYNLFPLCFVEGKLVKDLFRKEIFTNINSLRIVEDIIHPFINQKIQELCIKEFYKRSIVIESALIFEKNIDKYFDIIIYVYASKMTRLSRFINYRMLPKNMFYQINRHQFSPDKVFDKCHIFIYNESRLYTINLLTNLVKSNVKKNCFRYRNNRTKLTFW